MTQLDDLNPDCVLVFGDVHGVAAQVNRASMEADRFDIKVLVQVGDFGIWGGSAGYNFIQQVHLTLETRDQILLFVDGNHENFDLLYEYPLNEEGVREITSRIWHLPRGHRWTWHGRRFGALGGAHSVDRQSRTPDVSWWDEEWVSDAELEAYANGGPVDVLFMHDSPGGAPNWVVDDPHNPGIHWFPAEELEQSRIHRERLAKVVNPTSPALIVHGHYHMRMEGVYHPEGADRPCKVIGLDEGGTRFQGDFIEVLDVVDFQAPESTSK